MRVLRTVSLSALVLIVGVPPALGQSSPTRLPPTRPAAAELRRLPSEPPAAIATRLPPIASEGWDAQASSLGGDAIWSGEEQGPAKNEYPTTATPLGPRPFVRLPPVRDPGPAADPPRDGGPTERAPVAAAPADLLFGLPSTYREDAGRWGLDVPSTLPSAAVGSEAPYPQTMFFSDYLVQPSEREAQNTVESPDAEGSSRREPIGPEPEEDINQLFLRQQTLLLQPGDLQYDVGFLYNWQDTELPTIVPPGLLVNQRFRRRDFVVPLSVRYGLTKRVELFASLPAGLSHLELSNPAGGTTETTGGIGDLTTGFIYGFDRHRAEWPQMTLSFRVTAPTGDASFNPTGFDAALGNGFWSLGTALNFVQSYDPLVMFASVGYRHDFQEDFLGVWVQPGERISYSYGIGYAVNDDISLVTEFFGEFQGSTRIDGRYLPSSSSEPLGLRLSLIRRVTPILRLQPFISFGLNKDAPDASFGVLLTRDFKKKDGATSEAHQDKEPHGHEVQ